MTIEQKINKQIEIINNHIRKQRLANLLKDIEDWRWKGMLNISEMISETPIWEHLRVEDNYEKTYVNKKVKRACWKIDNMIKKTETIECLMSPSEYIRECKKQVMQNLHDRGWREWTTEKGTIGRVPGGRTPYIDNNCTCDFCILIHFAKRYEPTMKNISEYLSHPDKIIRTGAQIWYHRKHPKGTSK